MAYPQFNGVVPSWAELKIAFSHDGGSFSTADVASLDWDDSLEPGDVYGQGAGKLGRTKGKYSATAKISIYDTPTGSAAFEASLAQASASIGIVGFDISASWDTGDGNVRTVEIKGCRVTKRTGTGASSGGTDPSKTDYELNVMLITVNGVSLLEAGL